MIRVETRLSRDEYAAAKLEARRRGISVPELVRRSLCELIDDRVSRPWMRFAGMIDTGNPASSRTIDDVIYGAKD